MLKTMLEPRNVIATICVAGLMFYAWRFDLPNVRAEQPFGVRVKETEGGRQLEYIRDFPAHLRFTRDVWRGWDRDVIRKSERAPASAYSPFGHWLVMHRWLGLWDRFQSPPARALPFGYSPTMIYLLGPLTLLPDLAAFSVWMGLGWVAVWWMARTSIPVAVALIVLSPLALRSQALGQTAILSTAALVFLIHESKQVAPRGWLIALILWALTAKPPLALTAGVALIALRCWRPVLYAVVGAVVSTLLIWPLLGPGWVGDYVHMLTHYTKATADPLFAWSLGPEYMSNLRAMLSLYLKLPDEASSRITSLLWLAALPLVAWRGGWRTAILTMLVLGPHVNSTEDLALIAVAAAAPSALPVAVLAVLAVWATPGYTPPVGLLWPLPAFVLKVAVLAAVLLSGRTSPQNPPPPS